MQCCSVDSGARHVYFWPIATRKGWLAFQNMPKTILASHVEREQKDGKHIWFAEWKQDEYGQLDGTCEEILSCAGWAAMDQFDVIVVPNREMTLSGTYSLHL